MPWFLPRVAVPAIPTIMNAIAGTTNQDRSGRSAGSRDGTLAHITTDERGNLDHHRIRPPPSPTGTHSDDAFSRNDDLHRGALTLDAMQGEPAAVQFDQALRQWQSKPGAFGDP